MLLSNASSLQMTYVADVKESVMPPYFVYLLGLRMGMAMAIPLTKSESRLDAVTKLYEKYEPKAKFADSAQQPNQEPRNAPFVDVRC